MKDAVLFKDGMIVNEKLEVLANHEHVKQALVHDLKIRDRPLFPGIANQKLQPGLLPGLGRGRNHLQVHSVFHGIGNTCRQLHAAARTGARSMAPNVGVHRAGIDLIGGGQRNGCRGLPKEKASRAQR